MHQSVNALNRNLSCSKLLTSEMFWITITTQKITELKKHLRYNIWIKFWVTNLIQIIPTLDLRLTMSAIILRTLQLITTYNKHVTKTHDEGRAIYHYYWYHYGHHHIHTNTRNERNKLKMKQSISMYHSALCIRITILPSITDKMVVLQPGGKKWALIF